MAAWTCRTYLTRATACCVRPMAVAAVENPVIGSITVVAQRQVGESCTRQAHSVVLHRGTSLLKTRKLRSSDATVLALHWQCVTLQVKMQDKAGRNNPLEVSASIHYCNRGPAARASPESWTYWVVKGRHIAYSALDTSQGSRTLKENADRQAARLVETPKRSTCSKKHCVL